MKKKLQVILFIILSFTYEVGFAQENSQSVTLPDGTVATYEKPDWKTIFMELPHSTLETLKLAFAPDTFWPWMGILSSTAVLYEYDEDILLDVQKQGRNLGFGNADNTKTILRAGDINLIRVPTDTGSFLYFIGDGWTQVFVTASFFYYGVSRNDYRAWNTSYQIVHGLFLSTFYNQFLKRATGREAPTNRTEPRGRWRPFPSIKTYSEHTADYDAMPSGHVMTGTMVMTIINENYPEYSHITLPIGISLLSLLSWQMMNNGVHWASDYPLGIAMGIFYGKYVANQWKHKSEKLLEASNKSNFHILPIVQSNMLGATLSYDF
ncbi:MAG: phosphatase PAP2 family protein [Bdellovibrionaceae bacterium]|nr:phosphatase PAP2 family protein [Pseudobdellovibrionaceae bacterium]